MDRVAPLHRAGWAWLVVDNGKLAVVKTPNAENPITSGKKPILVQFCPPPPPAHHRRCGHRCMLVSSFVPACL